MARARSEAFSGGMYINQTAMIMAPMAPPRNNTAAPTRPGQGGGIPGSCNLIGLMPADRQRHIIASINVPTSMAASSITVSLRE